MQKEDKYYVFGFFCGAVTTFCVAFLIGYLDVIGQLDPLLDFLGVPKWDAERPISYATILETYSLEELLELNDLTSEECLEYLVEEGYIELPEIKPLDFEWLQQNTFTILKYRNSFFVELL